MDGWNEKIVKRKINNNCWWRKEVVTAVYYGKKAIDRLGLFQME
jgi:hypothetical protein